MTDPKSLFGKKLRLLRKGKGLSQEKLALECDIDRSYIGGVERGERNISLVNICKLAKCLNVSPMIMLDFSDIEKDEGNLT